MKLALAFALALALALALVLAFGGWLWLWLCPMHCSAVCMLTLHSILMSEAVMLFQLKLSTCNANPSLATTSPNACLECAKHHQSVLVPIPIPRKCKCKCKCRCKCKCECKCQMQIQKQTRMRMQMRKCKCKRQCSRPLKAYLAAQPTQPVPRQV